MPQRKNHSRGSGRSGKDTTCGQTHSGGAATSTDVRTTCSGSLRIASCSAPASRGSTITSGTTPPGEIDVASATALPSSAPTIPSGITIGAAIAMQMSPSSAKASMMTAAATITTAPRPVVSTRDRDSGRLKRNPATAPITSGVPRNSATPYVAMR